jgi:hypothetical protein
MQMLPIVDVDTASWMSIIVDAVASHTLTPDGA